MSATPALPALPDARAPHTVFLKNQAVVTWFAVVLLIVVAAVLARVSSHPESAQYSAAGGHARDHRVGQTMVVLSGGADLSQATVMTLSAVVAFKYLGGSDAMIAPVILLCLALGAVIGAGNGVMVSKVKVPPFLMTLGTRTIVFGLALMFTKGAPQGDTTPLFRRCSARPTCSASRPGTALGRRRALGLGAAHTDHLRPEALRRGSQRQGGTTRGRADRPSADSAYIISGVLAALGGLVLGARSGNADNVMGNGYELNAIAAVVIGGTSFAGGQGGVMGTVGGVLMMTVLQNSLNILGSVPTRT